MLTEVQLQKLADSGASEDHRGFQGRARRPLRRVGQMLGQELRGLVQKVRDKSVKVEKAITGLAALGGSRMPAAGGQDGSDAWAAAAASRASHPSAAFPPETVKKNRVELRNWSDHKRLHLDVKLPSASWPETGPTSDACCFGRKSSRPP